MRKRTSPARLRVSGRDRCRRSAPWTAVAAAMLLAGLPAGTEPYEPPRPASASGRGADPGNAAVVDLRRPKEAVEDCGRAIQLDPDSAAAVAAG